MVTMKDYVITLLKNYNTLKQEREVLQYECSRLEFMPAEETIEAMTFSSAQGEHVDGGTFSNKTASIAMSYMEQHLQNKQQALVDLTKRIQWITDTLQRLDFYLNSLEAHHVSILLDYYVGNYSWQELQDLRGVTYRTLMKHRNLGVDRLVARYTALSKVGLFDTEKELLAIIAQWL